MRQLVLLLLLAGCGRAPTAPRACATVVSTIPVRDQHGTVVALDSSLATVCH